MRNGAFPTHGDAPNVARPARLAVRENAQVRDAVGMAGETARTARCSTSSARAVESQPRSPSSLATTALSTAGIATKSSDSHSATAQGAVL